MKKLLDRLEKEDAADHEVEEHRFQDVVKLKELVKVHEATVSKKLFDDLLRWKRGEI